MKNNNNAVAGRDHFRLQRLQRYNTNKIKY